MSPIFYDFNETRNEVATEHAESFRSKQSKLFSLFEACLSSFGA